jgi:hypothetical protein
MIKTASSSFTPPTHLAITLVGRQLPLVATTSLPTPSWSRSTRRLWRRKKGWGSRWRPSWRPCKPQLLRPRR